jgi:large subunit ribosomal protein L4
MADQPSKSQPSKSQPANSLKVATIGKQAKSDLPGGLFSEPYNESLVHEAARADLNARRQGSHSSLTRGEVAMTGAKAWRQKGTGRARVGALSVPHRRGGGNAFATKPRTYTFKVNRKARRKALRSALSVHAARGSIAVLGAGTFSEPATKQAAEGLAKWGGEMPALVVVSGDEAAVAKSFRNLPRVSVVTAEAVGVAEIVGHRSLIVSEDALGVLEARAGAVERGGDAEGSDD